MACLFLSNLVKSCLSIRFDYGGGKDDAIRELRFTRLPPVLHISLNRFKYNVKSNSVQKNNDQFKFYPELDLSELCPGAVYTLHSVLGELKPPLIKIC